ncbi:ribosomal protein S18-alanine N-acetyltransferase [Candidatus Omnitrophota bacterium]
MNCLIRFMHQEDIAQVNEIDREAFPTQWPPPNYLHELQNHLAHYIIAFSEQEKLGEPESEASSEKGSTWLVSRIRQLFNHGIFSSKLHLSDRQYISGFAGFWIMANEAHITNIAVRQRHLRQGLGELLLISLVDLATELKAQNITLEVRASNIAAQNLYSKYGFIQVGVRRGYYTDNKEDGILMSTEDTTSASYQTQLSRLKQAHARRWGIALYQIVR